MRGIFLLIAALAVAAACSRPPQFVATGEDWRVELTFQPGTAVALRPVTLRFHLTDRKGVPLEIRDFKATAGMPEMEHGESRIAFRETSPGTYEGAHTFSMDGQWVITLKGRRDGAPFEARVPVAVGR